VLTVQTWIGARSLELRASGGCPGAARCGRDPLAPTSSGQLPGETGRRASPRQLGRQRLPSSGARRSSSPPASLPVQPRVEESQRVRRARHRKVLGLDGQVDVIVVGDGVEEPAQRELLLFWSAQGLVVEVGPRVLPGGGVELVELREVHRGDQAFRVRRPVDPAVVDADQVPVGGQAYVALETSAPLRRGRRCRLRVCSALTRWSRCGAPPVRGRRLLCMWTIVTPPVSRDWDWRDVSDVLGAEELTEVRHRERHRPPL
jgi:hypothetical protein